MPPANRELHVVAGVVIFPTHPGPHDQLAASRKDSVREGGLYRRKACAAYFCKVPDLWESDLGSARYGSTNRGRGVFLVRLRDSFPIVIPARPGKILAIREFHVMHGMCLLSNVPGLADQLRCESGRLCAQAWQRRPCTEASLGSQDMILRTEAVGSVPSCQGFWTITPSFLRPFLARKVSNRSSHHVLQNGQGAVSSIQLSVWSMVRSNLGQTWSTLVKLGQNSPNPGKCIPGPRFEDFLGIVGPSRVRNGSVKPRSNLVNSGQTWSTLVKSWEMCPGPSSWEYFDVMSPRRNRPTWFGLPRFACRHPRKSRGYCEKSSSVCVSFYVRRAGSQPVDTRVKSLGRFQILGFLKTPFFLLLLFLLAQISRSGSPFALLRSRNEICDSGPNRPGPPSPRNGDESGTNRPGPPRSRNEICDSGPNRSGPPSPRNGDESGTNRPGPSRSRNEICDSGPNRSGPPSPRNGDESGTNRPGPPRSRNEICDSGPNRSGPPSPRNGDELGTNRPGPPRSRNEICDSGPNRSGPPSPRNGDELGTNRPGPPRSRNEICDSGPNRSGPPSPRNGDESGTNRPGPPRSRNEICDSGPNRSGPPSPRNGDESGTNRPGPPRSRNEICDSGPNRSGPPSPRNGDESGTNRPGPSRSRNEICDSGPNRSGPPSPRNGDESGTNRPGPPRSRNEICDSGPNRSGPPSPRNGDESGTNRPGPPRCLTEAVVAEIVAGPHVLDSCECMNIEDAMRASLRWLLLCLLGRSALASHTLGLAISQVSCRFETLEGWVLYIQEAHFYHHRVLLLQRPISSNPGSYSFTRPISALSGLTPSRGPFTLGSYSFTRPISSSSGLTPSRGPFLSMSGLTPSRGPFLSMSGLTPSRGPFLSMSGLTPSRGPFLSMSGLTPSRGPFQQLLGLTPSRGPFLSMSGLTPSRGPFLSSLGLTPS
uniref:Uncharacterized protein n=1 Tax=Fagus sylvatica TaxID=28930 RepID=A0A2N9ED82_FAGSY